MSMCSCAIASFVVIAVLDAQCWLECLHINCVFDITICCILFEIGLSLLIWLLLLPTKPWTILSTKMSECLLIGRGGQLFHFWSSLANFLLQVNRNGHISIHSWHLWPLMVDVLLGHGILAVGLSLSNFWWHLFCICAHMATILKFLVKNWLQSYVLLHGLFPTAGSSTHQNSLACAIIRAQSPPISTLLSSLYTNLNLSST